MQYSFKSFLQPFSMLILSVLLIFTYISCSDRNAVITITDVSPEELVRKAAAGYPDESVPDSVLYLSGVSEDSENYLEFDRIGALLYWEYAIEIPEWDCIESYAMHVPNGKEVFEISILKVKDGENVLTAKGLLEDRLAAKSNGDVGNYNADQVPFLEAAEIYTVGNYAILLTTTDNQIARGIINSLLTGDEDISDYISAEPENSDPDTADTDEDTTDSIVIDNTKPEAAESETKETEKEETASPPDIQKETEKEPELQKETESQKTPETMPSEPETEKQGEPVEKIPESVKTETPVIKVSSHMTNTKVLIAGKCEAGSEIHIQYLSDKSEKIEKSEKNVYQSDYTDFMGVADIASSGTTEVKVTAKVDGKDESEPVVISLKAKTGVDVLDRHGIYGVIIGDNYQMHIKDYVAGYTGQNLLANTQINALKRITSERVKMLSEFNGGEIVFVIIPSPMTVYPETVPSEYERYAGETLREQFASIAKDAGATVIDLTDVMIEHKNDEFKIYHKTDTHWTQYGAYLGYRELMNHISGKFPDVSLRGEDMFEFYNKEVYSGDMMEHLEIDSKGMQETATFVNLLFDSPENPNLYADGRNILLMGTKTHETHTVKNSQTERELPTAYIIRDSFSSPIYGMMNDAFKETNWLAMWNYTFTESTIKRISPDYVIYLVSERNLKSVLG